MGSDFLPWHPAQWWRRFHSSQVCRGQSGPQTYMHKRFFYPFLKWTQVDLRSCSGETLQGEKRAKSSKIFGNHKIHAWNEIHNKNLIYNKLLGAVDWDSELNLNEISLVVKSQFALFYFFFMERLDWYKMILLISLHTFLLSYHF